MNQTQDPGACCVPLRRSRCWARPLAGCAPLLVGGAVVGGTLMATDRRTTGTQVEDETHRDARPPRASASLATLGHVNVTSYNRTVLITGEVPSRSTRRPPSKRRSPRVENVRGVVNELGIGGNSTLGSRSNDTIIAGKVKATMVDAKDLQANAFKVVSERGIVYLMGRVTEREAARGAEIASSVSRRAEGRAGVRDPQRRRTRRPGPARSTGAERRRRADVRQPARRGAPRERAELGALLSRLIRLDVSQRLPPSACTSA